MGWQGMALAKRDTEFLAEAARLASEPVTERAIEGILGVVQHGMGLVSASVRAEDSESWTSGLNDPNADVYKRQAVCLPVRAISIYQRIDRPVACNPLKLDYGVGIG